MRLPKVELQVLLDSTYDLSTIELGAILHSIIYGTLKLLFFEQRSRKHFGPMILVMLSSIYEEFAIKMFIWKYLIILHLCQKVLGLFLTPIQV